MGVRGGPQATAVRAAIAARDPDAVLVAARAATASGDHDVALRGFVWFHRNALRYSDDLYGVRLSFALAYWHELGRRYEPAQDAFIADIERGVARLRKGTRSFGVMHDVASMLSELGREAEAVDLFHEIEERSPRQAAAVFLAVRSLLRERGEHETVARYLEPSWEVEVAALNYDYERTCDLAVIEMPHLFDALARYTARVTETVEVLWAVGRRADARMVAAEAARRVPAFDAEGSIRRARRAAAKHRKVRLSSQSS